MFLGDLVDRGPEPVRVVRRVRELGAECVMGNHDAKHVRWAGHEAKRRADPAYRNPMKPFSDERAAQHAQLSPDDLAFLAALPTKLSLGGGWWAVHAGAAPRYRFSHQKPAVLMHCRWVDAAGNMLSTVDRPPGAVHWASAWRGAESIVYGHHVHDLEAPHTDRSARATCVGIDTGCCYGGKLTAYELATGEVVQVAARAEYSKLDGGDA